jgi:hypothetical protein
LARIERDGFVEALDRLIELPPPAKEEGNLIGWIVEA